jgi:hypothetical protein
MNGYDLSRSWFNFRFENPTIVRAIHTELYFFVIDKWNRLGQKDSFGLPTQFTMDALGIGSYNTYKKAFSDLVEWGFITVVQSSSNQYQAQIIALSKIDKATDKALDRATIASSKTDEATDEPTDKATDEPTDKALDTIVEQRTKNNKSRTISIEQRKQMFAQTIKCFSESYGREMLLDFYYYWSEESQTGGKLKFEMQKTWNLESRIRTWEKNSVKFERPKMISQTTKFNTLQDEYEKTIKNVIGSNGN